MQPAGSPSALDRFAAYVKAVRERETTLSQKALAARMKCSERTVLDMENGKRLPQRQRLYAWEQAIGTHPEAWELYREAEQERDLNRLIESELAGRDIPKTHSLTNSLVVTSPAVGLDDLRHIVAALDDARRYLDGAVVDYFRRHIAACGVDDGAHGPKQVLPPVLGIIGVIEASARQVKPSVRRELLSVGAQGAEFAGWLYRDLAMPQMANHWRDRAIEWAQESGDRPMQGYVLLRKSQAAWDERDALRMLTLAQAVQDGPWDVPPKVRAEAAQQEARGHAMLGGDFDLVERKLDEARQLLAEDDGQNGGPPAGDLGEHYDASLLAMQTAICYQEARQPTRAVEIYRERLSGIAFSHRDYGYFTALMATALAAAGEPDEAAEAGLDALSIAVATNSTRTTRELRLLVDHLGRWPDRSTVRELRDAVVTIHA